MILSLICYYHKEEHLPLQSFTTQACTWEIGIGHICCFALGSLYVFRNFILSMSVTHENILIGQPWIEKDEKRANGWRYDLSGVALSKGSIPDRMKQVYLRVDNHHIWFFINILAYLSKVTADKYQLQQRLLSQEKWTRFLSISISLYMMSEIHLMRRW